MFWLKLSPKSHVISEYGISQGGFLQLQPLVWKGQDKGKEQELLH